MTMKPTRMDSADNPSPIPRLLNLEELLSGKSHFLFGPRQTGKTFLARRMLKNARFYDLLDSDCRNFKLWKISAAAIWLME